MNGKAHAATALLPGGGGILRFSLERRLDEPQRRCGRHGERSYRLNRPPRTLVAGINGQNYCLILAMSRLRKSTAVAVRKQF